LANHISAELIGALRRHPLWANASDQSVRVILQAANEQRFRSGEFLHHAGEQADSIFLLLEGAVRMFYPAPNKTSEITVVLFSAPAAFGDAEALVGKTWNESVEALLYVRTLRIDIATYLQVLTNEPRTAVRHYRDLGARFSIAIARARTVATALALLTSRKTIRRYGRKYVVPDIARLLEVGTERAVLSHSAARPPIA
jgi:CRP-like cAMP-binding protein